MQLPCFAAGAITQIEPFLNTSQTLCINIVVTEPRRAVCDLSANKDEALKASGLLLLLPDC